jgi:hypothetical protein
MKAGRTVAEGRHDQTGSVLDRPSEERGVLPAREVLEPPGRIADVHARSGSLSTDVSIPRRNPRMSFMRRIGISSTRSS